ncbi:phage holin family protein [Aridibaculum aurantiacum]|uniref:phage holin family protein n=1 Tax=Aridibaculum aurantiacum TaxID=2810307 RepID=UPI001A95F7D1|nr:phage holin family protein [Aridibaculum aurantiacum]
MSKQPTLTLIESLFSQSKDYIENRIELLKLKAVDKSASVFSAVVSGVIFFVVFFIFFVILNIGLALLIGDLVGKSYLGFLLLAAFYLIIGLVLFAGRNTWMKSTFTGMIIKKFL